MQRSTNSQNDNEVSIIEIVNILLNKKIFILVTTLIAGIFSVFLSLSLTNIYTSSALLAPAQQNESMTAALGGSYSAIAGMAGINLSSGTENKSLEAIERIKSLDFFANYFLSKHQIGRYLCSPGLGF